jgi:hypothetical protein
MDVLRRSAALMRFCGTSFTIAALVPPLVEQTDILGSGIFLGRGISANDHFNFVRHALDEL